MTDMLIESAQLSGHVNPFGMAPSFTIPIFRTLTSNAPFVQKIDVDDKVIGFHPVNVETNSLTIEAVPVTLSPIGIGDEAIWTFQLEDGKCVFGSREELISPLKDLLGAYPERNFLRYQLIRFCRLDDLAKDTLRKAYDSISKISPVGSSIWRDMEVILPSIAESVVSLSREGVLDISLLPHLRQLRIAETSKKGSINVELPQALHDAVVSAGASKRLMHSISPHLFSFRLSEINLVRSKEAERVKAERKSEIPKVLKSPAILDADDMAYEAPPLLVVGVGDFGKSVCLDLWRAEKVHGRKYHKIPDGWRGLVEDIRACESIGENAFISRTSSEDLFSRIDILKKQQSLFKEVGRLRGVKPVVVIFFGADRSDISVVHEMAGSLRKTGSTVIGVHVSVYSKYGFIREGRLDELGHVFNGIILIQDNIDRRYAGVSPRVRGLAVQAIKAIYAFTRKKSTYSRFVSSLSGVGKLQFSGVFHSRGDALDQSAMGLVDELSGGYNIRSSADRCFLLVEGMDIEKSKIVNLRKAIHDYGLRLQTTIGFATRYKSGFALDLTAIVSGRRSKDVRLPDPSYTDFCVSLVRREGWRVIDSPPRPSRFFTGKKASKFIQFFCSSGSERQEADIIRIARHYSQRNYHPVVVLTDKKTSHKSKEEAAYGIFCVHHKEAADLLHYIEDSYFEIILKRNDVMSSRTLRVAYEPFVQSTLQRYLILRGAAFIDKKLSKLSNVKLEGLSGLDFTIRQGRDYLHFIGALRAHYVSWRRDLTSVDFDYSVSFDFVLTSEGLKYNFIGLL